MHIEEECKPFAKSCHNKDICIYILNAVRIAGESFRALSDSSTYLCFFIVIILEIFVLSY